MLFLALVIQIPARLISAPANPNTSGEGATRVLNPTRDPHALSGAPKASSVHEQRDFLEEFYRHFF